MTSFSPEPEFWVEDGPGDGSGGWDEWAEPEDDWTGGNDGAPPEGPTPPKPPRHWPRWVALAAGLVVIAGLIAWQSRTGTSPESSEQTSTQTPPAETGFTAPGSTSVTEATTSTTSPGPAESVSLGTSEDPCASGNCRGGVVVQSVNPIPSFLAADPLALPGAPFELIGLQGDGEFGSVTALLRYRSDTGAMVRTEVSAELWGPVALTPLPGAILVTQRRGGVGAVVPDGERAAAATGLLANSGPVVLAADGHHVWVTSTDYRGIVSFTLADPTTGEAAGQTIDLPADVGDLDTSVLQGVVTGDGAGYLLVRTIGGVYDARPDDTQLVTHGELLATGPTGYLAYECDKAAICSVVLIDRATADRTAVAGYGPSAAAVTAGVHGILSPDGRYAALIDQSEADGPALGVIDLHADSVRPILLPVAPPADGDVTSMIAFTPDSARLIVISGDYVRAVDPATGDVLGDLPVPPKLSMIAVRPLG